MTDDTGVNSPASATYEEAKRAFCNHPRRELRKRINVAGRPFYKYQCQDCGAGIGGAVALSVALVNGQPPPFDAAFEDEGRRRFDAFLNDKWRAARREAYETYLQSDTWQAKRAQALARDKYICQGCLACPATQVHHSTYDNLGNELLFELISVCDECHKRFHFPSWMTAP